MRYLIYFLFLVLCSNTAYAQKIYKWTDANGKTHYGDRPVVKGSNNTVINTKKAPAITPAPISEEAETEGGSGEDGIVSANPNQSNASKCLAMARESADLLADTSKLPPNAKRKKNPKVTALFKKMQSLCPGKAFKCSTYTKAPEDNICTASVKKPGDGFFDTFRAEKKR